MRDVYFLSQGGASHHFKSVHDLRLVCTSPNLQDKKWYAAAIISWGIALFEYLFLIPANRLGYSQMSLSQLKILQEIITLGVFVPFAVFYMRQPFRLDFIWAALCMIAAAYFIFRG